jgi:hypothetical protein
MEDRNVINDINYLRKKVENLSSSILTLKNNDESNNNSLVNKQYQMDGSRFVEFGVFNDFRININKEVDTINYRIDELKNMINDILNSLQSKASDKNLQDLESK